MITLILAMSENNIIGDQGRLPWHLPRDLKHFKQITLNQTIVMGRRTFESIGRLLPRRKHIILSRDIDFCVEGATIMHSLDILLNEHKKPSDKTLFIIGGGQLYMQSLAYADQIYLTRVHTKILGDTFFPELSAQNWQLISNEFFEKDQKNKFDLSFQMLKKIE